MGNLNTLFQKQYTTIITHALIWMFLIVITGVQSYQKFNELKSEFYVLNALFIFIFYLNYTVLVSSLLLNKKVIWYVLISAILILFFTYLAETILAFFKDANTPKGQFINLHPKRPKGPERLRFGVLILLFFALGTSAKLIAEWYKNDKEKVIADSQKVNSELSFLRAQLNPHFLFNTLNNIYSLSNKNSKNTTEAILKLSELMRYMIYEANEQKISLEKEIEYIKNYISLQLLRLKDSSGVKINIHGELNYKIEPLLLISFIENAFKYGTDYKGKTDIRIRIKSIDKKLDLEVINTFQPNKKNIKNSGIGLQNIKNRLNLLYQKSHTLLIDKSNGLYKVNLTLHLKDN